MPQAAPHATRPHRLDRFGTTIFAEMTALAIAHDAVNLAQGFPDFDGPEFIRRAAADAIAAGHNQYARTQGIPALNHALAQRWARDTGLAVDPDAEVTVTSGCTEALAACFLGLLEPGDEVVLFEPYYDAYHAGAVMAGAAPRFVTLRAQADGFAFDPADLDRAITPRTRALVLNTPHNPTGKVFTRAELESIAAACHRADLVCITDEVYERLTFDPRLPHQSIAALPGMAERTITCSSLGKTFSLTGWKIGWAIAPRALSARVRAAHQFLTFATATPLQHAAAVAIIHGDDSVAQLVDHYRGARDRLSAALDALGLRVLRPDGTYFIMADHSAVSRRLGLADDVALCRHLTTQVGVAAIPPSGFYHNKEHGRSLVRFAFCKSAPVLDEAIRRLRSRLA